MPQHTPKALDTLARAHTGRNYDPGIGGWDIESLVQCLAAYKQPERPVLVAIQYVLPRIISHFRVIKPRHSRKHFQKLTMKLLSGLYTLAKKNDPRVRRKGFHNRTSDKGTFGRHMAERPPFEYERQRCLGG
jgi:hypothetical protein